MQKEEPTFTSVGDAAQRVLQNVRRKMDARKWQRYQVPVTDASRRLTRRIVGEREDD
mgnify:CR=1 FL=1